MRTRRVVTCFLVRDGRVLVLQRSPQVRTYRGKWAAVSGTMETDDAATEALREVREELRLEERVVQVRAVGEPLVAEDPALGIAWEVHPVLAELSSGAEPRLDWEHTAARWVAPEELAKLDAVPRLADAWERVRHAA